MSSSNYQKRRKVECSIDNIPNDVLALICSFIPYQNKNWLNVLLVNKRFCMIGKSTFDPSIRNNFAIRFASRTGQLAMVNELLKDSRVDPSVQNNFAIRWASENGHVEVVRELLKDSRVNPSAPYGHCVQRKYAPFLPTQESTSFSMYQTAKHSTKTVDEEDVYQLGTLVVDHEPGGRLFDVKVCFYVDILVEARDEATNKKHSVVIDYLPDNFVGVKAAGKG